MFIGRTDVEAEAPILGYLMQRADSLEKTMMLGKMQEEKGTTENEVVEWHHQLNRHESEQIPGESGGQGSLACCSSCGGQESDTIQRLLHWQMILYH